MRFRDRIAYALWRDRYEYDPAYGTVVNEHLSLLGRVSKVRKFLGKWERDHAHWLVPLVTALAAAVLTASWGDLRLTKPSEQVNANAGELLLRCQKQTNEVLRCVPVGQGKN